MDHDNSETDHEISRINEREIWTSINNTIISLLSSLNSEQITPSTEESLHQLLESLLSRFDSLNILVPQMTNGPVPEDVQKKYTAFTTWLFGAMFYMINLPVNIESLKKIIEIQVCMVRILSRLNLDMHFIVTTEYLDIFEELVNLNKCNIKFKEMKLVKFLADKDIINYLKLEPFPIAVKYGDIPLFQTSIIKIIAESDVSTWPKARLKDILLEILVYSEPIVKISALQICVEMFDYHLLNTSDQENMILYATEIVKSITIWKQKGLIATSVCQMHASTFKDLLMVVDDSRYINFYFEIFSALINFTFDHRKLELEACQKIESYLIKFPKLLKENVTPNFITFFNHSKQFIKIITSIIIYEINQHTIDRNYNDLRHYSNLWSVIKNNFYSNLQQEKYEETCCFLRLTVSLDIWFSQNNISLNLLGSDIENMKTELLKVLALNDFQKNQFIYDNFSQLISLQEVNKNEIQSILSLPWLDSSSLPAGITKFHVANAKSLDSLTKAKCINSISLHGKGCERLNLFSMCISGCDIKLGVACVTNCPLLLLDKDIKFDGIMEKILIPAYNSQKPLLHDALTNVIGDLACLVSENGIIKRDSDDPDQWLVKCDCCNFHTKASNDNHPKVVSTKYEVYFKSLFDLLNSNSKKVRLNMSKNMIKLSCHVQCFNSNETALKWISYVRETDEDIRKNFGESIGYILNNRINSSISNKANQDDIPADLTKFVKIIMDNLVSVLNQVLETSDQSMHQTLILTAKNAACIQSHLTEQRALNIFILTILHEKSTPLAIALAHDAYRDVAVYNKIPLKTLYVRYKRDIMKLMMTLAVHNRINFDYNMSTTVHRVAKCMGFQGSRQLLRRDGQLAICFLLPLVVKHRKAITLFSDIAELINADEKEMFKLYFQHICARVFLFENLETGIQIFKLVSSITDINIPDLTAKYFTLIINELMLHFHSQKEKVLKHLQFLTKYDDQTKGNFKSPSEIAQYLSSILHGMLVTFDANLGPNCEECMQKITLASLAEVIRFMGPTYISQYKYKILATLRTALSFSRPGFRKLACNAWDAFLKNTTIKELGPLLATICISLVPLLDTNSRETNSMLEFLLIKNKESLQEHIQDLFFINDLKISPSISTRVINCIKQAKPKTVEENIKLWIKRINHQTDEVRLKALYYLQQYFAKHRNEINDMILSDVNVHPLIVELLDLLMAGCQDKNEAICIASGDCIGELGAIEPSLLPRRIISRGDTKFISEMNQEFAYGLFYELVRDYQSQNTTQSMDCFSLAIQEILRIYEISPGGKNCQFWNDLPTKIQRMIYPLLTSHYTTTSTNNDIEFPTPIYGSESGSTYEMWVFNWTVSMLKTIKDNAINNVLNACRPAFKRNIKIMSFCIPYIVTYVISNGTEVEVGKLFKEMLAIIITTNEKFNVDPELNRNRPLRAQMDNVLNTTRVSDEARRVRCLQVIFSTLDHLQRWLREKRKSQNAQYKKIQAFCDSFPKLLLAQGCYQSYEYHRALIYLEQHMASSNKGLSEPLEGGLLAKIYTQLEEPDGVTGILVSQDKCPTLQQLVLAHEVSGQLQDAATCYERLLQNTTPQPKYLQGIIQCYLGLDQPYTAMSLTKGILDDRPELETLICDSEPFWQLAHFGKIGDDKNNVKLNILQDLKNCVKPSLFSIKKKLVSLLTASSRPGAYEQSYSYIMKLHIVNEFEKACTMMLEDFENLPSIFEEWGNRDKLINASRGAEFVLGMRRAILDLAVQLKPSKNNGNNLITEEIGQLWLKSAKIARKAGLYQQAYMYILSATDTCPPQDLCIEQAQLYWQKGSLEDALTTLKRCLTTLFRPVSEYKKQPNGFPTERKKCAKARLLWAKYNDETFNIDASGNMVNYKEALEVWKNWEKSCLAIARYYETLLDKMNDEEQMMGSGRDMQVHIVNYYGKALLCGCKYIHQSLPRMLTIWLNYASRIRTINSSDSGVGKALSQMTKIVEVYIERVPIFIWLTAFSQLVSRICHPNKEVQNTLFTIIVKSIKAYPQHCLWMMASVFNSSYSARQKCCKEILNRDALKTKEMLKLIQCFHKFWERLIELSNKHIPEGVSSTTVNVLSRSLPKLLADQNFGPIMMPTSKFRQLHLPMKGAVVGEHNPFTLDWVKIEGINDSVIVMPSLQRPRRISLRGSDGNSYLFMCKPKDDLRRDFRLMEFNDIVNCYLQKDPEARRRRLSIRTYSVVPLNEECGLIEWVPNLTGYRQIIMGIYKERNCMMSGRDLKAMVCGLRDSLEKKRTTFVEKILPRHPPVFGDWFQFSFPDPYGWYEARTAYIRTTAVISMVGYILGLGDRHGENILMDSKNGDCVHVDFNCLFNRGESLEWPERVPFRLTHNMIEAMGPLKYEGPFRESCRTTMKVLRSQASTLLSVLKPFVYDPLVTWNKNQSINDAGEKTNEKAVENIRNIEDRLKGMVARRGKTLEALTVNLSVEGQVNHLILEATNVDNLCQMYIGWGAYY